MSASPEKIQGNSCKPLLKWAGGKTQLLSDILPKLPETYNKFIEPFIGGGATFFALNPHNAIISDSNPELINLYTAVRDNPNSVIQCLEYYENTEDMFYKVRGQDISKLSPEQAAARTIFLNKTCFNGLYRVNKKGQFNVPFGRYKNPKIIDSKVILDASRALSNSQILLGDYKSVLREYAEAGDVVFLDPPYLPISEYSDFKRYTKEQFYEDDHRELAEEVRRLHELNCFVVLTNSNHPLVHELYGTYTIEVIQTKRFISSKGSTRTGEDVIVTIPPKAKFNLKLVPLPLPPQALKYPSTRFMGSKNKLLEEIWAVASQFEFDNVIDLFSGSGIVGYMFKSQGKSVVSNDYMSMSATFTKAMIQNNRIVLSKEEAQALMKTSSKDDKFVQKTFKGLYFSDDDNKLIDKIRANIKEIKNQYKRAIAMSALIRTCLKKRPRGIFTYVGERYNDGRKDLLKSFKEHFLDAVEQINNAVFNNDKINKSYNENAMDIKPISGGLIYIDPPYFSPLSDNEYVRRYHFVEGLARDWKGVEIQENTLTKKFKSYPTPFSTKHGASEAFNVLFKKFRNNILIVSYSSNSLPALEDMISIIAKYKTHVEVVPIDYKYSFGNQAHKVGNNKNSAQEYLFVGY